MCLMVYMAAAEPLRLIDWDDVAPGFYVEALDPDEERVRKQFGRPHVVYAGTHEGCGCGFRRWEQAGHRHADDGMRRRALQDLGNYLRDETARVGAIEIFVCRDGEQTARPAHRRTLTPAAVEEEDFSFLDNELSTITAITAAP
jgi:hypothetical protein